MNKQDPNTMPDVYESRMAAEREHYKAALKAAYNSVDDWLTSPIREPAVDFLHALKHFLGQKLLNK